MRDSRLTYTVLAVMALLSASCGEQQDDEAVALERFPLRGEVVHVLSGMDRVVIRHDAIEGWSRGANMEYPVDDPAALADLSVGDQIRAVVFVRGRRYRLGEIEVISTEPEPQR